MIRVPTRKDLYAMLPPGGTGAELGVLDGFNSVALLDHAKPAVLHLVDVWREYPACHPDDQPDGGVWLGDSARDKVIERLALQIAAGQVKLHQADTVAWLAVQPASSLDWVYLDSDHSYPHVRRELCQAMRVVKASGWICGHDYAAVLGGVVAAVDEFCREHGQALAIVTDEIEEPVNPRLPWSPATCPYNSFAIQLRK